MNNIDDIDVEKIIKDYKEQKEKIKFKQKGLKKMM